MLRTMLARLRAAWRGLVGKQEAGAVYAHTLDKPAIEQMCDEIERETMRRMRAQYGAKASWARGHHG